MRYPEENYSGVNCSVAENSMEGYLVEHYQKVGCALLEGAIRPGDCDGLDFRVRGRAEGLYLRARQRPRLLRLCLSLRRLFTLGKYLGLLSVCGRAARILVGRLLRPSRMCENTGEHECSNRNAHEKSAFTPHPLSLFWSTVFYARDQGQLYLKRATPRK